MKERIFSIILMFLILAPICIIGGLPFKLLVILISFISLKELLELKKIPIFIKCISFFLLLLSFKMEILQLILVSFVILSIMVIIYKKDNKFSIESFFYLMISLLLLSIFSNEIISLRINNCYIFLYLLLITICTDTFAYLFGSLFGKYKLIENISYNKTIEGLIFGSIAGVVISTLFYNFFIDKIDFKFILITCILSLLGTFGDLFFSLIKREHNVKDYSRLIPGHGGVVDRIDSMIFVIIGYILFF